MFLIMIEKTIVHNEGSVYRTPWWKVRRLSWHKSTHESRSIRWDEEQSLPTLIITAFESQLGVHLHHELLHTWNCCSPFYLMVKSTLDQKVKLSGYSWYYITIVDHNQRSKYLYQILKFKSVFVNNHFKSFKFVCQQK